MAGNTLGHLFRVSTFGESHGEAVGAVIDGVPAGFVPDMDWIQRQLDRRRPGQSAITTRRSESDCPRFVSGLFEGKTTGAPICFLIPNEDTRSEDYDNLRDVFRPGHADLSYQFKYGHRDYRGGGRSSARTMAPWVCAGALAQQILRENGMEVLAYVSAVGEIDTLIDPNGMDHKTIDSNPVRCPDPVAARRMEESILEAARTGDSLGGVISCLVTGVPPGLGEPQFTKLPAMLAHAMMSINATKGFEMGDGFALTRMRGSEANDPLRSVNGRAVTATNRSGGVLGGISNGMPLFFRVGFKPVSTLAMSQNTIDSQMKEVRLEAKGRHDPCVVPRAVPIVEAMTALVLIDLYMIDKARK